VASYSRTINYDQKSSTEQIGFAQEVFGGRQQNAEVNGDKAWNVGHNGPVPQLASAEERQLLIWMTPHGFIKAGLEASDTRIDEAASNITFTALGKYKVSGVLNDANQVVRVETTLANPVLGDVPVVFTYSRYKDWGVMSFPTQIVEREGGFPVWELTVNEVRPNPSADLPVPDVIQNAPAPKAATETTKLADGVWFLTGGSHHSVVAEFKDYVAVIEGPLNEERSLAVLAEAKKLVPDKPVKYVISTHHHFDHTGGLRTYVAQGVTVITHESNKDYFEKIFQRPSTVTPDTLGRNPKPAVVQGVTDKYVLTDGKQTIEVYATQGDNHTDDLLVAYFPGPKILVEADSYSPPAADAPPPSPPPANAVSLYDNIQRLKLNVATIAPIHGRGAVPMAEFKKYIGKS
jgi:glyoxylase-like metal-dependent hydrolase (beta-lactamase superfamily II)